tara:strand:- start:7795 stop:8691 length:897 start_codon:yes stop_codon:yes gene_type:complete
MKLLIYNILIFLSFFKSFSQELNAEVIVNSNLVNQTDKQVFNDFQNSVFQFLNSTRFTTKSYSLIQKIDCSFIFTINSYDNNEFNVNLDVNSLRQGFNSSYKSSNFLFRDIGINFKYQSNEPIIYSDSRFTSDLSSLLSFYSKIIIGFDKDSFSENSGINLYQEAKEILDKAFNLSISSTWSSSNNGGRINKYWLIDNLISNNYDILKRINYKYYRNGIDFMVSDKEIALSNIKTTIELFSKIDRYRPNSILKEIFFQSKNDEIYNIFNNDLDIINIEEIKLILNKTAPFYSSKWNKL